MGSGYSDQVNGSKGVKQVNFVSFNGTFQYELLSVGTVYHFITIPLGSRKYYIEGGYISFILQPIFINYMLCLFGPVSFFLFSKFPKR